jgi:hypothetical protein
MTDAGYDMAPTAPCVVLFLLVLLSSLASAAEDSRDNVKDKSYARRQVRVFKNGRKHCQITAAAAP